ncbi:hypothetical protein SAMN05216317_10221 [Nitrosomonas eutropha]|uniref:Uncharacterized protein n=1 Tax=Nitrosomonas eutropha TaxID=916 RepID=A0ABX5M5D0_9PROT|nr:hypothetical protein C8R14_12329 [Nitrosomonas eutropha]SCX23370.1 hypothetical protein SAMN05216379_1213 [Nitrosomonas eutropha]SDW08168.1 hypothetical protein SAMN05216317_10221 [Nitrosomonas eutropha]SEI48674.1 hypothetical protein SAMN05216318_10425 [Nitrosomonas eutropha]
MDLDSLYIYILYYFRSCLIRGVAYRILFRTEGLNGLCPSRICCATPNPIFILFSLNYVVLLQHSGSIHKKICFLLCINRGKSWIVTVQRTQEEVFTGFHIHQAQINQWELAGVKQNDDKVTNAALCGFLHAKYLWPPVRAAG